MSGSHTRFYRDKQNGKISGVASGVADYTGIDALIVRIALIVLTIVSGGWVILAYLVAALTAPKKPAELYLPREEQRFWQGVRAAPSRSAREVKGRYNAIDRRLADLEALYTDRNRALANEIDSL